MSASPRVTSFSEDSLREWFCQYDEDGTGLMDEAALGQLCEQLGLDPHSAPDIMKELDTNKDGKVSWLVATFHKTRRRLCRSSLQWEEWQKKSTRPHSCACCECSVLLV